MKRRYNPAIRVLILAVTLAGTKTWGQVDPDWLRSWNEAQEQKPDTVLASGRIAPEDEPGPPLLIRGFVAAPDGGPATGVLVHAYHRDRDGLEFGPNDNSLTAWRLHGWARTDAQGRFEFRTIRPAPDNLGREGAHIHFTLESVDFGRQWAPKVFFSDDPLVTARQRRRSEKAGDFGSVIEARIEDGVQHIDVRFRLKEEADF